MYSQTVIAPGIYQLRFYDAQRSIGFNQYLIAAEQPALVSTGAVGQFEALWAALGALLDPRTLRWLVVPHFEADEAGAVAAFLARCPGARPVCAAVAARQLAGFGLCHDPHVVADGDTLALGSHRLRFLLVPWEMHLWPGLVAFEETYGVLFSSDLFGQRLDPTGTPPDDLVPAMAPLTQGAVPARELRAAVYDRLAALPVRVVAPGHGFAFPVTGDLAPLAARVEAVGAHA
jgi:flavorubredoxin